MRLSRPNACGGAMTLGAIAALLCIGRSPAGLSQTAPAAAPAPAAQTPATAAPAAAHAASGAQPVFSPSMGDLMTMLVQPRHIKLGLGGKAGNWVYASYELSELRNAFGRIAHTIPTYRSWDTAQMIAALMQRPLNALDHAIIAQDAEKFAGAFAELTEACNACHATQQHPMVVIKAPASSMYPDQDFRRKP